MSTSDAQRQAHETYAAVDGFLAGAVAAGLRSINASPGSRSTPLILSAARRRDLDVRMHLDERSAAFAALGEAFAAQRPVMLMCTSGTAGLHYAPAIAEANLVGAPVVAVTADRPPEHQGWGVGQTIRQRGLFHGHVRSEVEMPVGGEGGLAHAVAAGRRVTVEAASQSGPIHVNWPFRLPLEPPDDWELPVEVEPGIAVAPADASSPAVAQIDRLLAKATRPLVIAGPYTAYHDRADAEAVLEFAARLGAPVIADVLSGLRRHRHDHLVAAPSWIADTGLPDPDLVLHLGHTPTAKNLRLWWETLADTRHVIVGHSQELQDPSHCAVDRWEIAPAALARQSVATSRADADWIAQWRALGHAVDEQVEPRLAARAGLTEHHIARSVLDAASGGTLFAASSMPIRDIDSAARIGADVEVLAHRGANGIDGTVAATLGVSRARPNRRVYALIGDVALLHDLGSVLDAIRHDASFTIIVVNNDGGGIFEMLPVRHRIDDDEFDASFRTSHGTTFDWTSTLGLAHDAVADREGLEAALRREVDGLHLIECRVDSRGRAAADGALRQELSRST